MLTEEQKNDELVKSLIGSGFAEDVIEGWINSGAITLEKSVEDDKKDKSEPDDDEKKEKEEDKEKKQEGEEKDDLNKGKGCKEGEKVEKSIDEEIIKSIQVAAFDKMTEVIEKSLPDLVAVQMEKVVDKIEKSLQGMRDAIVAFGDKAPSFKGASLNKAIIEKAIEQRGGGAQDGNGKTVLSVSRDRSKVIETIEKAIAEEPDESIQKSLRDNTLNYIVDPVEGAIGEPAGMYLYTKKDIRLVK